MRFSEKEEWCLMIRYEHCAGKLDRYAMKDLFWYFIKYSIDHWFYINLFYFYFISFQKKNFNVFGFIFFTSTNSKRYTLAWVMDLLNIYLLLAWLTSFLQKIRRVGGEEIMGRLAGGIYTVANSIIILEDVFIWIIPLQINVSISFINWKIYSVIIHMSPHQHDQYILISFCNHDIYSPSQCSSRWQNYDLHWVKYKHSALSPYPQKHRNPKISNIRLRLWLFARPKLWVSILFFCLFLYFFYVYIF